eukprot:XP_014774596.1 PREDICTED: zinc finger BED domain-containing protein 5-like [Octopus bimaculoides]
MDRCLIKKKRDIDEREPGSEQNLSEVSCSNKKLKPRPTRKYDVSYLSFGFTWTGSEDHPLLLCLARGNKMSNESLLPGKLSKHLKNKHPHLQDKSTNYFKRLSEQQTKVANSFINKMTVSEKAQIASYQVSGLIAQNMKAHTIGESLILPVCKKVVSTILGNEVAKEISKIPLSNDTVHRRILEMSSDIKKNVCSNKFKYSPFSLEVLMTKTLGEELKEVLDQVVQVVNFIKTRPVKSRIFEQFCTDLDSQHKRLPLHTEGFKCALISNKLRTTDKGEAAQGGIQGVSKMCSAERREIRGSWVLIENR